MLKVTNADNLSTLPGLHTERSVNQPSPSVAVSEKVEHLHLTAFPAADSDLRTTLLVLGSHVETSGTTAAQLMRLDKLHCIPF